MAGGSGAVFSSVPWQNIIELGAQVGVLVVACISVWLAIRSEKRSRDQFDRQLKKQDELAENAIKPYLALHALTYSDKRGIVLTNHGSGSAIITKVEVTTLDGNSSNCAAELFQLDPGLKWDDFRRFAGPPAALAPGKEIVVLLLTEAKLRAQGKDHGSASRILGALEAAISGMQVEVGYTDAVGREQPVATLSKKQRS